jgi:hypothetical protein
VRNLKELQMTHGTARPGTARLGLAATAAFALIAGAAILPASAQTQTYPAGTDCTKLVGNSKMECERASKNTGSPDNSNNPDNGSINTTTGTGPTTGTTNSMPSSTTTNSPSGEDCTSMVGNSKEECEQRSKNSPSPDNSNNPDQTN